MAKNSKNSLLGEFITKRRDYLGYQKCAFADLLNVGRDTLLSWEKGKFKPAGINKRNLIKFLKMSENEIQKYF